MEIYICYIDQEGEDREELYHVAVDPLELSDLSEDPGSIQKLEELRKRYDKYLEQFKR